MQKPNQPFLASFSQRPLLISADSADFFKASIEFVIGHEHAEALTAGATSAYAGDDDFWAEDD